MRRASVLCAALLLLLLALAAGADPYRTLGVPRHASIADIKRAYRQLARKLHPDRVKGAGSQGASNDAATRKFIAVNAAFEILSDASARRRYDLTGEAPGDSQAAREAAG